MSGSSSSVSCVEYCVDVPEVSGRGWVKEIKLEDSDANEESFRDQVMVIAIGGLGTKGGTLLVTL